MYDVVVYKAFLELCDKEEYKMKRDFAVAIQNSILIIVIALCAFYYSNNVIAFL